MSNVHLGTDMSDDRHSVQADERLATSRDRQVSFRLPMALDQRLDALVDRAVDAGERTNRREILSAILYAAAYDGNELGELLRTYRRAQVREAILDLDAENVVEFARHAPGPRSKAR